MSSLATRPTKSQREAALRAIDTGTPERAQHNKIGVYHTAQAGVRYARVETQTLLDRYLRRDLISDKEYDAGQKLYALWRRAGCPQTIVGSYGVTIQGRDEDGAQARADAWHSYCSACSAMGRRVGRVVINVCCYDEHPAGVLQEQNDHAKAGLALLRAGLDDLVRHWGLK